MSTIDLSLMPLAGARVPAAQRAQEMEARTLCGARRAPVFGLLNLNALMAAHDLFVPVLPDFLSFHGLKLLLRRPCRAWRRIWSTSSTTLQSWIKRLQRDLQDREGGEGSVDQALPGVLLKQVTGSAPISRKLPAKGFHLRL